MTTKRITLLTLITAAAFSLASCAIPSASGGGASGSVSVTLGAPVSGRAATAPTSALVKTYSVTLTDAKGATFSAAGSGSGSGATFTGVYPGSFTVAVTTCDAGGTANGSGSGSGTLAEGGSAAVNVIVTINQSGGGSGSMSLAIAFPTNLGITDVSASFIAGDSSSGVAVDSSASPGTGTATLSASALTSGIHYLAISFLENGATLGTVIETVNIWNGVTTNLWLSAGGTTTSSRAFTSDEIAGRTADLASLTVAGKNVDLATALVAGGTDISGSGAADYVTADSITFVAVGATYDQNIAYTWNGSSPAVTVASGTATTLALSATSATNTLVVTVASPGGEKTKTYTAYFTRRYVVSYSTAYGTAPAAAIAQRGSTINQPVAPSAPGMLFAGWHADAAYSTAWVFGTGGTTVSANTVLYAKWVTAGTIVAYLTDPEYLGIYFKLFGNVVTSTTIDKDATFTLSVPAGGTSYKWYFNDDLLDSNTAIFNFTPKKIVKEDTSETSLNAGGCTISVAATYGNVTYSGNLVLTVSNDAMVTVIPGGMTAIYNMTSVNEANITSYDSSYAISYYNALSPYSIAKTETTYTLWHTVYSWAIAHGYAFQNAGSPSAGAGYSGASYLVSHGDYPVGNVTRRDILVWCNAYTEMMDGSADEACYRYDGNVIRDSTEANAAACDNAVFDRAKTGYRLPTESEWQFAATGRGSNEWNRVSGYPNLAWTAAPTGGFAQYATYDPSGSQKVAQKLANELGLFDMSGNSWEVCFDRFNATYPSGTSYSAPVANYCAEGPGSNAVIRSGSWGCNLFQMITGYRHQNTVTTTDDSNGFRLARTIE